MKNYYDTLGVSETASDNEIKTAFRKLAAQHHPDKGGNENKFKEINEAYDTLKSTQKRQEYDAMRKYGRLATLLTIMQARETSRVKIELRKKQLAKRLLS